MTQTIRLLFEQLVTMHRSITTNVMSSDDDVELGVDMTATMGYYRWVQVSECSIRG